MWKNKRIHMWALLSFLGIAITFLTNILDEGFIGGEAEILALTAQEKNELSQNDRNKIPFSAYREIYKRAKKEKSAHYFNKNNELQEQGCEGVKKGAIIELIFLRKTENGRYKPHPVRKLWARKKDESDCGENIIENLIDKYSVYRILVTDSCTCEAGVGLDYNIETLGEHTNLHYTFRIPGKNQLQFQKQFETIQGKKTDHVYRIPILLEEVLKTKKKEKRRKKIQFDVKGLPDMAKEERSLMLKYVKNNNILHKRRYNHGTNLSFEVSSFNKGNVLGGTLYVYNVLNKDYYLDRVRQQGLSYEERKNKLWVLRKKMGPETLISYKRDIKTTEIDMSKNLDFEARTKKWIKKTISIKDMLKKVVRKNDRLSKKVYPHLKEGSVSLLEMARNKDEKKNGTYHVSKSPIFEDGGQLKARLKAPAGEYQLRRGSLILKESIKWPPSDESDDK